MAEFTLLQVDAFTDRPLAGNPCAVVLDADALSEEQMQAIALEMNLSETAFLLRSSEADFRARYFTPAEEIPLAGHPTIALTVALMDSGRLDVSDSPITFSLELPAGIIPIEVAWNEAGRPVATMTQLKPSFLRTYSAEAVAQVAGLDPGDILPGAPVQTVSTGTPMLMVPLRSRELLCRVHLDLPAFRSLRENGDFFSAHFFCLEGATESGDTFARHLGVPPDTFEDPFTGSATGCMGAYLWRYGLVDEPRFVAEQGHWMGRPGSGRVEVVGPRDAIESVRIGGSGVTILRGQLTVNDPGATDSRTGAQGRLRPEENSRPAPISHLVRREAQAPLVSALIEAFGDAFGKEEAEAVAREVIREDAIASGRELAARYGGSSLDILRKVVEEVWAEDGTMEVRDVRLTERTLEFDVTRCGYAEMYKKLGLQELGSLLSCSRDFPFQDGFNPDIRLERSRTVMEGADCCDFRYVLMDRSEPE